MKNNYFLKCAILIMAIVFSPTAFACSFKDAKEKIVVELQERREKCNRIVVQFPEEFPSSEEWKWAIEGLFFEIKDDNGTSIKFSPNSYNDTKEGFQSFWLCLPDDVISNSVLTLTYDQVTTKEYVKGELMPVSMCRKSIVLDNLNEIMVKSDSDKSSNEKQLSDD